MVQGIAGPEKFSISRQVCVTFLQPNEDVCMTPLCQGGVDGGATLPPTSEVDRQKRLANLSMKGERFGDWFLSSKAKAAANNKKMI
jgi:hypothetical protein